MTCRKEEEVCLVVWTHRDLVTVSFIKDLVRESTLSNKKQRARLSDSLTLISLSQKCDFVFFFSSRIRYTWTATVLLKMATPRRLHLHPSLNLDPRVLRPLRPRSSRGSSGEGSTSSCSLASGTAWDWGTCGDSPTFVIATEEVSGLPACPFPSEISSA